MVEKDNFIERTLFLIRKLLEENLPGKDILDNMIEKRNDLLKKFMK